MEGPEQDWPIVRAQQVRYIYVFIIVIHTSSSSLQLSHFFHSKDFSFYPLSHHFLSRDTLPCSLVKCLNYIMCRGNGEVVPPAIKINIYKMLCVKNQYHDQEGKRGSWHG